MNRRRRNRKNDYIQSQVSSSSSCSSPVNDKPEVEKLLVNADDANANQRLHLPVVIPPSTSRRNIILCFACLICAAVALSAFVKPILM
jgi:hypothetical protein